MNFDSKETEEYFYNRLKDLKITDGVIYTDDVLTMDYVKSYLEMIEASLINTAP